MANLSTGNHVAKLNARELSCSVCGKKFISREPEQAMLAQRGWTAPNRCPVCRKAERDLRRAEAEQQEDQQRQWKMVAEKEIFDARLKDWCIVSKDEIHPQNDHVLYMLGNGFDLMHRVQSSYYSFRDSLGKENSLRYALEHFLTPEDIWADFEGALAHFDLKAMCGSASVDVGLDLFDAYDANASDSAFFLASDMAADPVLTVANELQRRLRMWVEKLSVGTVDRPLRNMFRNGKVLCFNYTEFVETLYSVSEENVCYIHGCRRRKRGRPKETLIMGHAPGASEEAYDFEDNPTIGTRAPYKIHMIEAAQEQALHLVAESDETLTKNCGDLITAHEAFFAGLNYIDTVVVIGHSFSPVDWDYFREVTSRLPDRKGSRWYFGCHGLRDLEHLEQLLIALGIERSAVSIFRTDTIVTTPLKDRKALAADTDRPAENTRCTSPDGKWAVKTMGHSLLIVNMKKHETEYETMLTSYAGDAFFVPSGEYLFVIIRGADPGVLLFRMADDHWRFVNELASIPNQSVINRRLRHVFLTERKITFVYNSRVRMYSLADGTLISNRALRNAKNFTYDGDEVSDFR